MVLERAEAKMANGMNTEQAVREAVDEEARKLLGKPPIIVMRTDYLQAAAIAASTDKDRAYLCAVFVEVTPEYVQMTSTDGHHLITIKDDTSNSFAPDEFAPFKFLIPAAVIKNLPDLCIRSKEEGLFSNHVKVALDGEDITFISLAGGDETKLSKIVCTAVKGEYPNYRRVIPDLNRLTQGTPAQLVSFAWNLCHNIQRAVGIYRFGKSSQLAHCPMNFGGEEEPALFTASDNHFIAVVMPLRYGKDGKAKEDKPVGDDPFEHADDSEEEPE